MIVVGVDPGTRALGLALFEHGRLAHVQLVRAKGLEQMLSAILDLNRYWADRLVVERAEVYPDGNAKPNDLGQLLIVAGAIAGSVRHTRLMLPYPKQWKGQVPKNIHHDKLRKGLTDADRRVLDAAMSFVPPSLRHNMLDAVGLARWGMREQ